MRWSIDEVARVAVGTEVGSGADAPAVGSFAIDSRAMEPGACFVALRDRRDGHDFVRAAFENGAATALVARIVEGASGPLVVVDDPLRALGRMGTAARARLATTPLVAVAGSAGKTSTKDLTLAALGARLHVHGSTGSYNNEAGVPLTLLAADDREPPDIVVCEFGERRPGDLAYLGGIAAPTHAIITNVGSSHAEFLGGPEGVAVEFQTLLDLLPAGGAAVLNADDRRAWRVPPGCDVLGVGTEPGADVVVREVVLDDALRVRAVVDTPWGSAALSLELRGHHQALNAAMALAMACRLGVALDAAAAALATATGAPLRMELQHLARGTTVLNDTYNAAPASVAAALEAFARLPVRGRRLAVLGEMRELGPASEADHRRIGVLAAASGLEELVVVGPAGEWIAAGAVSADPDLDVVPVADVAGAVRALHGLGRDDALLLKASRALGFEEIVARLDDVPRREESSR